MIDWVGEFESKFFDFFSCVEWFQNAVLMLRECTLSYITLNRARVMFWGPESEKCCTRMPSPKRKPPPKLDGCPNFMSPSLKEMVLPASSLALLVL